MSKEIQAKILAEHLAPSGLTHDCVNLIAEAAHKIEFLEDPTESDLEPIDGPQSLTLDNYEGYIARAFGKERGYAANFWRGILHVSDPEAKKQLNTLIEGYNKSIIAAASGTRRQLCEHFMQAGLKLVRPEY